MQADCGADRCAVETDERRSSVALRPRLSAAPIPTQRANSRSRPVITSTTPAEAGEDVHQFSDRRIRTAVAPSSKPAPKMPKNGRGRRRRARVPSARRTAGRLEPPGR